MFSSYAAPCTTAILFAARMVELLIRRSQQRGTIISPFSLPLMVVAGCLVMVAGFAEYLLVHPPFLIVAYCAGLAVSLAGFALRAAAARALGSLWSVHIEIRPQHRIVETGPFRRIRHPIYASLLMDVFGGVIVLESLSALIVFSVIYVPVVFWRMLREERAMLEIFDQNYRDYAVRVPRLIPKLTIRSR